MCSPSHPTSRFAGSATLSPTLSSHTASGALPTTFSLDYTLPEAAQSGSVQMVFTRTGGLADGNSPHTIVFAASMETAGQHIANIGALSAAAAGNSAVQSVAPGQDLVTGAVYTVVFKYQDAVGNSLASVTRTDITFAGSATLQPTLTLPSSSSFIGGNAFSIDFELPEKAAPGTVQLTVTRTGGVADSADPRVIVFATSFETASRQQVTIQDLSTASGFSAVQSVTPANDLIDGTVYKATLSYQDSVNNAPATVERTDITFTGVNTLNPTLNMPLASSTIPQNFGVHFTLSEPALSGTVKMVSLSVCLAQLSLPLLSQLPVTNLKTTQSSSRPSPAVEAQPTPTLRTSSRSPTHSWRRPIIS